MNLFYKNTPLAYANIIGSKNYPTLHGIVSFEQINKGVLVTAEIFRLPQENTSGFFAFHIHSGNSCSGNSTDPFADALTHYNPNNTPHPYHAGDLPPLLANNGYAYMEVLTNRFTLKEIIDRVIIIHKNPDDFTTQPAGNAGEKIGCGKIMLIK